MHGREWITPAITTYFINQLITNFTFFYGILPEIDFYIAPVLNPDGYVYTHTTDRLWRKNRNPNGDCVGVDLAHNYGFHWDGPGSSSHPCSDAYRGAAAFSEQESKSVKNYIEQKRKDGVNWRTYFGMHSYGQMWLVPWAWTDGQLPEDYHDLVGFAKIGVDALTSVYGTEYQIGSVAEVLNIEAGDPGDWAKSEIFKYSQRVTVRDTGTYGFLLPPRQIIPCASETSEAILATAKFLASEQNSSSKMRAH